MSDLIFRIHEFIVKYIGQYGRRPTPERIALSLQISEEDVRETLVSLPHSDKLRLLQLEEVEGLRRKLGLDPEEPEDKTEILLRIYKEYEREGEKPPGDKGPGGVA